jgi:hypothetical protein
MAQVGTTCVRSTGNLPCVSKEERTPFLERASSDGFPGLRPTASAKLCHPRYKYRILFIMSERTVTILRVWHSSRDAITREDLG